MNLFQFTNMHHFHTKSGDIFRWIPQLDKKSFGEVWQKSSLAEWFASFVGGGGGVFDRDGGKKEGGRRKRGSCTYLGHFQATITIDSVKSKLDIAMTLTNHRYDKIIKIVKNSSAFNKSQPYS